MNKQQLVLMVMLLFVGGQACGQEEDLEPVKQHNVRISYEGKDERIFKAVELANEIVLNPCFAEELQNVVGFDSTTPPDLNGKMLWGFINSSSVVADVDTYKTCWRWSKANAYTVYDKPTKIYLNARKLKKSKINDLVATLVHEYVHLVDFEQDSYEFTHINNSVRGNQNTAPYIIDNIVKKILNNPLDK